MRAVQSSFRPCLLIGIAACGVAFATSRLEAADTTKNKAERLQMVRQFLESAGITDSRVLNSARETPRHEFVPTNHQQYAYFDMALPIGNGQTISPPYIVAFMTQQLEPKATDKVLEIGTGSGYQAAILSPLVKDVYSIEIVKPLGERAARVLRKLNLDNVHTKIGDGFKGWPEHAPFDKIIVTCSPEAVPKPLVDQLKEGGRMIVPVGQRFQQSLCLFEKRNGKLVKNELQATFFVPMTGTAEAERKIPAEPNELTLVNGGFEDFVGERRLPQGWYYLRQATIESGQAAGGKSFLKLRNTTAGNSAQALQAISIDGLFTESFLVEASVKAADLKRGRGRDERPDFRIEFYNENRAPCGSRNIDITLGTYDWRKIRKEIGVPVQAKLAVIGIGLFGGTGELMTDEISMKPTAKR